MFKEISIAEISGKVVARFAASLETSQAIITFTDGTFTGLTMQNPWQGKVKIAPEAIDLLTFGDAEIIMLGIATQKELNQERERYEQEISLGFQKRERKEYERLKKKYEEA